MRTLSGFLALATLALGVAPGRTDEPTQRDLLEAIERHLKAAHEAAGPAVACVVVSRSDKYPRAAKAPDHPGQLGGFDLREFLKAEPSKIDLARQLDLSDPRGIPDHGCTGGVVIDAAGFVLVNYHSIEGATKVYVHLPGEKGSYADIHAADARSDLAVLKLIAPLPGLKAIKLGQVRLSSSVDNRNTTVPPGKLVVLMANAYSAGFSLDRPSAGLGSVSNIRRRSSSRSGALPQTEILNRSIYNYSPILEFDARVATGMSGAALLNLDGELIGLTTTTAGVGGENGAGYALPLDVNLRRVIETLRRGEEVEYGFLGVLLDEAVSGVAIRKATPFGPADVARISAGDRIVAINDQPINTFPDLLLHVGSAQAGTKIRVRLVDLRGRQRDVDVTLAKFKSDTPFIASVRPAPVFGLTVDYSSMLAQMLGDSAREGVPVGVVIRELVSDSPAATKFKTLGDHSRWVITKVNATPVPTPADFYKATKQKQSLKLTIIDPTEMPLRTREVTLP